jgi:hypothetical protein
MHILGKTYTMYGKDWERLARPPMPLSSQKSRTLTRQSGDLGIAEEEVEVEDGSESEEEIGDRADGDSASSTANNAGSSALATIEEDPTNSGSTNSNSAESDKVDNVAPITDATIDTPLNPTITAEPTGSQDCLPAESGIIPRCIAELFQSLEQKYSDGSATFSISTHIIHSIIYVWTLLLTHHNHRYADDADLQREDLRSIERSPAAPSPSSPRRSPQHLHHPHYY